MHSQRMQACVHDLLSSVQGLLMQSMVFSFYQIPAISVRLLCLATEFRWQVVLYCSKILLSFSRQQACIYLESFYHVFLPVLLAICLSPTKPGSVASAAFLYAVTSLLTSLLTHKLTQHTDLYQRNTLSPGGLHKQLVCCSWASSTLWARLSSRH